MTMLKAITKGITILTAASSLLIGMPRLDCLCASTHSCPVTVAKQSVQIKKSAAPACCCCGSCGHESNSGKSCCGMALAVEEREECCETAAPESKTPTSNEERLTGFGCHACSSSNEIAIVAPTASASTEKASPSFGWIAHIVPQDLPAGNPCSPFRWKQYQLPPPPDLIITLQHYLI